MRIKIMRVLKTWPIKPFFFQKRIFGNGHFSVSDPEGLLRGVAYDLWIRPSSFIVTFDFTGLK